MDNHGYVIRSGDQLLSWQWSSPTGRGGMNLWFTDGTNTIGALDQDGQPTNNDSTTQSWHYRKVDLSAYAGKTISGAGLVTEGYTPAGPWAIQYTDIALLSTDGTVWPFYNGQSGLSLNATGASGSTRTYLVHDESGYSWPIASTVYYHGDQIESSRLMTSFNGYPLWQGTYLPYGEEYNPQPTTNHYKFTGKERDAESGLDNFGARYNSSSMGRFMTPDPLGGEKIDPQTLNKYSYVRNNPINLIDPTGLYTCADQVDCKSKQDIAFEKSRQNDLRSKDGDVVRAAQAYGDPTKDGPGGNKVNVSFADLDKKGEGGTTTSTVGADDKGNLFAKSEVVINSKISGSALDGAIGHEGSHVADAQDVVKSITYGAVDFKVGQDITRYQSEQRAYRVTDSILRSENESNHFYCGANDCILGRGTMAGQLPEQVDRILANSPNYRSNGQPLSPTNQGGSVVNGLTVPH